MNSGSKNCWGSVSTRTKKGQSGLLYEGLPHHDQEKIARDGNYFYCVVQEAGHTRQSNSSYSTEG